VSGWNTTTSSTRLRNSGLKLWRRTLERLRLHLLVVLALEAENNLAGDIRRHDHDSVAEIHRASVTVGEAAVVEQLQ